MLRKAKMTKKQFLNSLVPGSQVVLNLLDECCLGENGKPHTNFNRVAGLLDHLSDDTIFEVYHLAFQSVIMVDFWMPDYGTVGHGC